MPQFDPANFLPQLVWLGFFFAILYFVIVKSTLPRVDRVMDKRETIITDDLSAAERAKHEADSLQGQYEQDLAEAQARARTQLDKARESAAKKTEARLAKAASAMADKQAEAETRLAETRQRALAEIGAVAEDAASDIVERLIGQRPTAEEARAALAQPAAE
jgi:F-type H+-transporting ATPase subunit b